VDAEGTVIGRHQGSYGYTVGQRRGLRIDKPAKDGRPRYVLDIEPVTNTVRVGPAAALDVDEITAVRPVWSGWSPPDGPEGPRPAAGPEGPIEATVQLRAHGETFAATCRPQDGSVRIDLHERARGVARGQAAVLYDGDVVLGSATIAATACRERTPSS
jgi:tRNA-specific 2-thiouridylase